MRAELATKGGVVVTRFAWVQCAVAICCVTVAWAIRSAMDEIWGPSAPYAMFYVAIVVITWLCGTWVAIGACCLSVGLADFFFVAPRHAFGFTRPAVWVDSIAFLTVCGIWIFLVHALRKREADLRTSRERAEAACLELNKAQVRARLLAETANQLLLSSEPRHVVNALCAKVMAFLDCDAFVNLLVDEERPGWLLLNACAGIPSNEAQEFVNVRMDSVISGSVVKEGRPIIIEEVLRNADPKAEVISRIGIQAYACHPMKAQDRVFGTLAFGTRSRTRFTESELTLMKAVADLVAIALERQRSQRELQRMNALLEERVKERTRSLEEMTEQLNTFCHSVAHDLRSPLRTQIGFARVLLDEFGEKLGAEGRKYSELVLQAAERQSNIIQDLMAHVNVSRGDLLLERVSLGEAIAKARADLAAEMRQKEAEIDDSGAKSETVIANPSSLHLVILNLLTNACKFVPPGRHPRVKVWTQVVQEVCGCGADKNGATEVSERIVRLWVEDNGIGIDPKDQSKLFRMFQRLTHPSLYPGTGMGLAIVKKAVERMGGRVGAESEPGKGSRFWVELRGAGALTNL